MSGWFASAALLPIGLAIASIASYEFDGGSKRRGQLLMALAFVFVLPLLARLWAAAILE